MAADLNDHHGVDLGLWVRPNRTRKFKINKNSTCSDVYEFVAKFLSMPSSQFTLFNLIKRVNSTIRPDDILPNDPNILISANSLSKLDGVTSGLGVLALPSQPSFKKWNKERDKDREKEAIANGVKELSSSVTAASTFHALLFIKHFDPVCDINDRMNKLKYCGFMHVSAHKSNEININDSLPDMAKLCDINKKKMASYAVYEEVRPEMVDLIDTNRNLKDLELSTGDILVLQPPGAKSPYVICLLCFIVRNALKEYYDHLRSFTEVEFKEHTRVCRYCTCFYQNRRAKRARLCSCQVR